MKRLFTILALGVLMLTPFVEALAQCPMCRMTAESNLQNGGRAGVGLNAGILYLLAMPYLVVAVIGFIWYRNRKKYLKAKAAEQLEA